MTAIEVLANRIAKLEAIVAVERLIADLGRAFDTGPSAAALIGLFTPTATFQIDTYGSLHGAANIASGVASNADTGFRWTLHYLVSPTIDVADDVLSAAVSFNLWEVATSAGGRAYWIGGTYSALVVAAAGRWQFDRLELRADLISHYSEGWREKPSDLSQA